MVELKFSEHSKQMFDEKSWIDCENSESSKLDLSGFSYFLVFLSTQVKKTLVFVHQTPTNLSKASFSLYERKVDILRIRVEIIDSFGDR